MGIGTARRCCIQQPNAQEENSMIQAVDIRAELAGRPVLHGRGKETTDAEARAAFATLAPYRDGSIFAGSFSGDSPWERHPHGDELVHILDGATTLTIMTDDGPRSFEMQKGMLIVVPQGHWHRFHAPEQVTVLTATPQPTDHTVAVDPRIIA
jgi:mannose-6-phosphate isomerase-like protein (cupin superfamily)